MRLTWKFLILLPGPVTDVVRQPGLRIPVRTIGA